MSRARFDGSGVDRWRPSGFDGSGAELPLIGAADAAPILPGVDLWDCWPLEHDDGRTVGAGDREYWFFLSAPRFPDPGSRHDAARIRLLTRSGDRWTDLGPVLDPATSPGSREWAGSAVLGDDGRTVALYFTAAGQRGQPHSFAQRLFVSTGSMDGGTIGDWSVPTLLFDADGDRYVRVEQIEGEPGLIKGFRDPAHFRDPRTGMRHMLFTASAGWDGNAHNGVVGRADWRDGRWLLADPLIEAIGVNNELERPHIRIVDDTYYLFFSTQRRTFAPDAAAGPNGLYAFYAAGIDGPWRPVNGSGLVAANPAGEPIQAYSWWVTGEQRVISFIDHWGLGGRSFADHPSLLRDQFGGTPAPEFGLAYSGDRITVTR